MIGAKKQHGGGMSIAEEVKQRMSNCVLVKVPISTHAPFHAPIVSKVLGVPPGPISYIYAKVYCRLFSMCN